MHFKVEIVMRKIGMLFLLVHMLWSCQKENNKIDNLNNNKITVLGHGGMGNEQLYPINTYESILSCINLGTHGSEIDVQLTKDSVLVAYHDVDLSSDTDLSGMINDLNWSEIKNAKYKTAPYLSYSILSLEQLFSGLNNRVNYFYTFDCKLYSNNSGNDFLQTFVNSISKIIDKFDLKDNVYIESENSYFLTRLKEKDDEYKLFTYPQTFDQGMKIATELDLYGITISTSVISKAQVKLAHDNNFRVAIWGADSNTKNVDAVNKNPDFIQTDKVSHLVKLLE